MIFTIRVYITIGIMPCHMHAESVSSGAYFMSVLTDSSLTNWSYKKAVISLHCMLENGTVLYVN